MSIKSWAKYCCTKLLVNIKKFLLTCIPLGGGELMEELGEGRPPDDIPGDNGPPVLM